MTRQFDTVIIGAGAAGMAAAVELTRGGARVCLLDEQPDAGGQIYRSIGREVHDDRSILGPDYYAGRGLYDAFSGCSIEHVKGAVVWQADGDGTICYSGHGQGGQVQGRYLLLATGAQERPMPFPGWTLPGVMTCGAGQIALKSSGLVPGGPVVLAGSGPLLFLIAAQFLAAGVEVRALLETTPKGGVGRAMKHLPGALKGWRYLAKGAALMARIRRAGVPVIKQVTGLMAAAGGNGLLSHVLYRKEGQEHRLDTGCLMVHQGVVPNLQLTRALGCDHHWDDRARNWIVSCDDQGRSSLEKVFVAGDGRFIMGAKAAEQAGRLSAFAILRDLGLYNKDRDRLREKAARRSFETNLAIRPFLDSLYRPSSSFLTPPDDTIVCRCEEVSAGDIRGFARLGAQGPNQAKAFGRSGMGPCQGRQCGLVVSEIMAEVRKQSPAEIGYYNIRFPIKPVTLGEVAAISEAD